MKHDVAVCSLLIFDCCHLSSISSELVDVENFVEKHGFEVLCARDKHGYTPAHWVALDGNVEMMRYLVECNAPIDLRCLGTQGPRPIHWACRKGHASKLYYFGVHCAPLATNHTKSIDLIGHICSCGAGSATDRRQRKRSRLEGPDTLDDRMYVRSDGHRCISARNECTKPFDRH